MSFKRHIYALIFSSFSCNVPVSIHFSAMRTRNKLKNNEAIFREDIGLTLCRQLSVSVYILSTSTSLYFYLKMYLTKIKSVLIDTTSTQFNFCDFMYLWYLSDY